MSGINTVQLIEADLPKKNSSFVPQKKNYINELDPFFLIVHSFIK